MHASIADYAEEKWDAVIDVNLKGVWLAMKYQIPLMQKNGGGAIVNISSTFGIWLCSKESSFITGSALVADGGLLAE